MIELKYKKYIPNILTTLRVLLVPLFIFFLFSDLRYSYLIALVIFVVASVTDYFDGRLARMYNVESNYGMFMDPLADKALILSAFVSFLFIDILAHLIYFWMVLVILIRDLLVTGLRIVMDRKGLKMVTSTLAKLKTTIQLVTVIFILFLLAFNSFHSMFENHFLISSMILLMLTFTVFSGIDYYIKNSKVLLSNKST